MPYSMGIAAKVCRIDDDDRIVFEDGDALDLDDEGYLDLDWSWQALQTMISSVTAVDLFAEETLDSSQVGALAKALRPLKWKEAVEMCETPDDEDMDEIKPYYRAFRRLVMAAAKEGSGLRCEYS